MYIRNTIAIKISYKLIYIRRLCNSVIIKTVIKAGIVPSVIERT